MWSPHRRDVKRGDGLQLLVTRQLVMIWDGQTERWTVLESDGRTIKKRKEVA
jgi:hypothetical protein